MKRFSTYISKHLLAFIGLVAVLAVLNIAAFLAVFYGTVSKHYGDASPKSTVKNVAAASSVHGITEEAEAMLTSRSLWAMYLDGEGRQSWGANLPEELPAAYTTADIAVFSKGYLCDYPVFVWGAADGLLVVGYPKNSYMKITGNYYPIAFLQKMPFFFLGMLLFDLLLLFLFYSRSKAKISKNTEPIISSITALSEGKSIRLSVSGELSEIADSINHLSDLISRQNSARANWISGVSHDIRTPLSMIMGYAQRLADDENADNRTREQAAVISRQSRKIRELVQDLNLASRLEYDMQPLQIEPVKPARLLRSCAVELLNGGLPDCYCLEADISPDSENCVIECDAKLLARALGNLVNNSIYSNPDGCAIVLALQQEERTLHITVRDDGVGVSPETLEELKSRPHYMESTDERLDLRHGLGLLLVRQIVEAHHGRMEIWSRPQEGYRTDLYFEMR